MEASRCSAPQGWEEMLSGWKGSQQLNGCGPADVQVSMVLSDPLCRPSPLVLDESAIRVGLNGRNTTEGGLRFGV